MSNFVIIYLNKELNEETNFISQLNDKFNSNIKTFDQCDSCIDYITNLNNSVLLILPNILSETLVPIIHEIRQLVFIYIIYESINKHEDWTKKWKKVRQMYKDTPETFNQLHCHIRHFNEISVPTTCIKSSSISNYGKLSASEMYSLLLKECIIQTIYDENAKKEFTNYCRDHINILNVSLKDIIDFEENYEPLNDDKNYSPVRWYTKTSFIYPMLNKALRTQNIEVILKMGFFIQDLHCQLILLEARSPKLPETIVYRGQGMSNDELENMKNSKNGLFSFNNFLSTTTDRDVSYLFADSVRQEMNLVGILFEMKINPSNTIIPYTLLDSISVYQDEKEILFSMNTVFRIDQVKEIEDRLWQVNLTLISENDEKLTQLTKYIRSKTTHRPRGLHCLGKLMITMGELKKAEEIFDRLLERTSDDQHEQLASIHHHLGCVHLMNHDIPNAQIHFNKSVEQSLKFLPVDDPKLSAIYSNIGVCFKEQDKLDDALEYFNRALKISLNTLNVDPLDIAIGHNNIGEILREQGKYDDALASFNYALEIYLKHMPQHSDLGSVYTNVAAVYYSLENFQEALSYFKKTLEIYKKSLLFNHPSMALVHYNLARTLEKLGHYSNAVEHAKLAVDIASYSFDSTNHRMQLYQNYYDELQSTI